MMPVRCRHAVFNMCGLPETGRSATSPLRCGRGRVSEHGVEADGPDKRRRFLACLGEAVTSPRLSSWPRPDGQSLSHSRVMRDNRGRAIDSEQGDRIMRLFRGIVLAEVVHYACGFKANIWGGGMEIRKEEQLNPVADEVLALTSIVRPILSGVLNALKADVVAEAGGLDQVKLKMVPRLYRPGDGDVGICFEYAVHEAMNSGDARVLERISDALKICKIKRAAPRSILFGIEKTGAVQLIDTAKNILTDDSRTLAGNVGQPPKLLPRLNIIAAAFRRPTTRLALPYSIRGLWKADLFVGSTETQQWVGTTVKINPNQLETAAGLRIGITPTRQGKSDKVRLDDQRGLVICPLHHDADFMQAFYEGWRIVQAFIMADAHVPPERTLPRPVDREICRMLEERREYPAREVIEDLRIFGQPELLKTVVDEVQRQDVQGQTDTSVVLAPLSRAV